MLIQVKGYEFKTIKAAAKHYNQAYMHVIGMLNNNFLSLMLAREF